MRRPNHLGELAAPEQSTAGAQTDTMARKTSSRLELRRQAEAAESQGTPAETTETGAAKKKVAAVKKKAAPRARRTKAKAQVRKRLVWGVFSSSMKEEGRFLYADREGADAKAAQLAEKHKRTYFVQPIKEIIGERAIELTEDELADQREKSSRTKKRVKARDEGEDDERREEPDSDFEMPDFGDDDDDD
jgi:hypothetical protein